MPYPFGNYETNTNKINLNQSASKKQLPNATSAHLTKTA
jgi:hypothetical protein